MAHKPRGKMQAVTPEDNDQLAKVTREGDTLRILWLGQLREGDRMALKTLALDPEIDTGAKFFIVDLRQSQLEIGSAAMAMLVSLRARLRERGRELHLHLTSENIALFRGKKLDSLFPVLNA